MLRTQTLVVNGHNMPYYFLIFTIQEYVLTFTPNSNVYNINMLYQCNINM
jgi:hypothetical protein